jgi:nucleoid-associated protein YgaU
MEEKKKNIFQKAVDSISSRDEKEAMKSAEAETAKVKAKLEAVKKEAEEAKIEAAKLRNEARREEMKDKLAEAAAARAAEKERAEAEKVVKHVWTNEDTYASLAFKHYGSIQEPYWRLIYEHNKEIIGDHPNNIRTGLEIEIPPLPPELKK